MDEEFDLAYYVPGLSYEAIEKMPQMERRYLYEKLVQRKKEENDEYQDSMEGN